MPPQGRRTETGAAQSGTRHPSALGQDVRRQPRRLRTRRVGLPPPHNCIRRAGGTWMAVVDGFGGIAGGSGWAVGIECDVGLAPSEDCTDPCSCRQHEVDDFRHVAGRLWSRPLRRGPGGQGVRDVVEVLERQIMCRVCLGDRAVLIVEWDASGGAFGRRVGRGPTPRGAKRGSSLVTRYGGVVSSGTSSP